MNRAGHGAPPPAIVVKDMSLSEAEVLRSLRHLARQFPVRGDGPGRWRLDRREGAVMISIEPLPPLRHGLVELPRHRLTINFSELPEEDRAAFLARFDNVFRRGGG